MFEGNAERKFDRRLIGALIVLMPLSHMVAYKLFFRNVGLDPADPVGHIGGDFLVFWTAAKMMATAPVAELYDIEAFRGFMAQLLRREQAFHPWPYPPFFALVVAPLALLPYAWSYLAWLTVTFGTYLSVGLGRGLHKWSALALLLAPATLINVTIGQNGFLSAALFLGGFRFLDRRPVLAGILFGLLTFKPQLGVLIPVALIAARQWTAILSAAVTGLALVAISAIFFGTESWSAYLAFLPEFAAVTREVNTGLFAHATPTPYMSLRILGLGVGAAYVVQAVVSIAVIGAVYAIFRATNDRVYQLGAISAGVFLATPFAFAYDMPLLAVAVLVMVERALRADFITGERLVLGLAWFLPFITLGGNAAGVPVSPVIAAALLAVSIIRSGIWPRRGA